MNKMDNKNIFIATPIAGFSSKEDYKKYKALILEVIGNIKKNNKINIFCEITNIKDISEYDSPAKSVIKDFKHIRESEYFILLYPQKVGSSALIELGYALSEGKYILIISPEKIILPYMVLGFEEVYSNVKLAICEYTTEGLYTTINNFILSK